jgi:hypothetical protein
VNTENWRILDKQFEPKRQRLILHRDRDYLVAIKRAGYEIVTAFSQGTVKVLRDPEAQHQGELVPNTATSESVSDGGRLERSNRCKRGNYSNYQIYLSRSGDPVKWNLV